MAHVLFSGFMTDTGEGAVVSGFKAGCCLRSARPKEGFSMKISGLRWPVVILLAAAAAWAGADQPSPCEPMPDMFCVSQRVVSFLRDASPEATDQLFVYRFHDSDRVDIAHGNPPVTKTETLACVEGRTYKGLMVYSFSDDWRQGVAAFVDPGLATVEFFDCAEE
jgi:hypothetical protein